MLDLTKPTNIMALTMCISMVLTMSILYIASPSWIQKIDITGKVVRSWPLIISYSLTFTLTCGVIALIVSSSKRKLKKINNFSKPPPGAYPSTADAIAYAHKN